MVQSPTTIKPTFFSSPARLRAWLDAHHASSRELWIGFHRKGSGRTGITYADALDQALAFGWIDGVRKRLDATRFVQRFTPRQPNSFWSVVNIARAHELGRRRVMTPAGTRAFERRDEARTHRRACRGSCDARADEIERVPRPMSG